MYAPTSTPLFWAEGYYYTRDHLGSVRELMSSTGTIVSRLNYDPYGNASVVSGTVVPDFQYAGMYLHATSGLNFTLFRAYDPTTARWLSRDPLPDAERSQGPNLYEYVSNDPVDTTDPLGLAGAGGAHNPYVPPPPGSGSGGLCPCGEHLAFQLPIFSNTMSQMNGSNASLYAPSGGNFALNAYQFFGASSAEFNSFMNPYYKGYQLASAIGAFLGSWRCVQN